jgi:hypothetical protein
MENFLREYVPMIVEARGQEITDEQLDYLVRYFMDDDNMWDTFDYFITDKLDEYIGED